MKKILFCLTMGLLWLSSCTRPVQRKAEKSLFVIDVLLKTTPVKDQGRSTLCWVYAMLATIETNHLMQGDSVNLSPNYIARRLMMDEMRRCYLAHGTAPLRLRGMGPRLLHLLSAYGVVPYDSYSTLKPVNLNVLAHRLQRATQAVHDFASLNAQGNRLLDEALGYLPGATVHMLGADYTPQEFARSVCRDDEYQALTSFTHHPFGQRFALEVPDNVAGDSALNVPLDKLMAFIVQRLQSGRAVFWEGDVSSEGFDFAGGVAVLTTQHITQQQRQQAFERLQTTDDHAMALVGLAHDHHGNRYFIAKNSWGAHNRFHGFVYLSEAYVRLNTTLIVG